MGLAGRGAATLRETARAAVVVDRSKVSLGVAVRATVGVALPLVVGEVLGQPLVGVTAAIGALQAGFASIQGSYRSRVGVVVAASLGMALSAFVGGTVGHELGADMVLVAGWGFVAGLLVSLGQAAGVVGLQAVVILVVYSQFTFTPGVAARQAGWVVAGAAVQLLLVVVVWPFRRFPAERRALGTAFGQLAGLAAGLTRDPGTLLPAGAFDELGPVLRDPQPFGGDVEMAAHNALANQAERIRLELAALARARQRLGPGATAARLDAAALAASSALSEVAASVEQARLPSGWEPALAAMDRAVGDLLADPAGVDAGRRGQALAGQLRAALRVAAVPAGGDPDAVGDVHPPRRDVNRRWVRDRLAVLRANVALSSQACRHGLRLAVTLAVAVGLSHFIALQHRYWLPMTVMIVLRADFTSTFTRGLSRVAGTLAGAGLVTVAIGELKPGQAGLTIMVMVFAFGAYSTVQANYAIFSVCIASMVVTLLAFAGQQAPSLAEDRSLYTAAGAGLALVAYLVWPTWEATTLPQRLASLLTTEGRYAHAVLVAWSQPARADRDALHQARLDARLARSNAEAAANRWLLEPRRDAGLRRDTVLGMLAAVATLVRALLTLHAELPDDDRPRPELEPLTEEVDRALAAVAETVETGRAPGRLAPLRDLHHGLLRRLDGADPVLASETDLIVNSVDTLAHLAGLDEGEG